MERDVTEKKKIKFVCISDTHSKTKSLILPKGDVLIHAGDFTQYGYKKEIEDFVNFLTTLSYKHIILIAGNHDFPFDECYYARHKKYMLKSKEYPTPHEARSMLSKFIYLENSGVELYGYKIWGSPVTPRKYSHAFQLKRPEDRKTVWQMIPTDTDILITHGPPFKILDYTSHCINGGCEELANEIINRVKPRYHIFGHLHEANGMVSLKLDEDHETTFINASICNKKKSPVNAAYVFELEDLSKNERCDDI